MQASPPPRYPHQDLNLRELVQTLRASKLWIIATTLIATCVAAAYAFLSSPVYEATVTTLPPTASGLASYNAGSQLTGAAIAGMLSSGASTGIKELSTAEVYQAFLLRLNSATVRQRFFQQFYLPAQEGKRGGATEQALWAKLNRDLSIRLPATPSQHVAALTLQGEDPHRIATWANVYVDLAIDITRNDLLGDLAGEVEVRKKGIADQIAALREVAETTRKDRITRIEDALEIAEAIGLELPPPGLLINIDGGSARTTDAYNNASMMYLRGSKALRSELDQLKQRETNDPYLPELTDLLKKQTLLESIDLEPERLSVAIIDRAAIAPEEPVRPNKQKILVGGFLLGAGLGVALVFLRRALTN